MTIAEQCHVCGGEALPVRELTETRIGKRKVAIEAERMRCRDCNTEFYLPGQMLAEQRAAAALVRSEDNLIDENQIIAIRKRLGLTQAQMEKLLGVGPKTVVRWERGTVFQSSAMDKLLRVIEDVPGAAEYLAKLHRVALSDALQGPALPAPIVADTATELKLPSAATPSMSGAQIIRMEDYLKRKSEMQPVPPELLREAQL